MKTRTLSLSTLLSVFVSLSLATPALAVPAQMAYQGRLLDVDEIPVDDMFEVSFRIMNAETGGNTLWEETQDVEFTNGFYSVILGADEDYNPLDDYLLDEWPLWVEVQLSGSPAMIPRMAMGSTPYARVAGRAEELIGGTVDADSLSVGGTEIVNSDGEWVGPTPSVDWSDLSGTPTGFADGEDADALGQLTCGSGESPVYDEGTGYWLCEYLSDTVLSDTEVITAIESNAVNLYTGTTLDGYTILVDGDAIDWSWLTSVPSDLADGDDDSFADLICAEAEIPVYSTTNSAWACGVDTDSTLSAAEVVAAVEAASTLTLGGTLTVGGATALTETSSIDWSQLTSVPTGLDDGDDDTDTNTNLTDAEVVTAIESAGAIDVSGSLAVNGAAVVVQGDTTDWGDLVSVPTVLADGDDDTLAALGCGDGEVASYDAGSSAWGCEALPDAVEVTSVSSTTSGFTTVNSANSLTTTTSMGTPASFVTALISDGSYVTEVGVSDFVVCTDCGTGVDGSWAASSSSPTASLAAGEYNFTDFTLPSGVTLEITGSTSLIIRSTGTVEIAGTIDMSGADGLNLYYDGSLAGGTGGPGGAAGADGYNTSSSWLYGAAGEYDDSWNLFAATAVTGITGGTGGAGGAHYHSTGQSGGGGGGGALSIVAPRIIISGSVALNGGNGGQSTGGQGSGGSGWFRASYVEISGTVSATGGTSGVVRIDAHSVTDTELASRQLGTTSGLPPELHLYQTTTGDITFTNHTSSAVEADIRFIE